MPRTERKWQWPVFGLGILVLAIIVLELKQPYYFTQDDNFAQGFPIILEGSRAFIKGAILDWLPYQFLGFPVASTGEYVLTYPPTYLSYAIARYLLGNELFILDVFCILHLIAGYLATYLLLRSNKISPPLAAAGSLSFILSGYTLLAGRSWFAMIASIVWMPLLFLSVTALEEGRPTWKWIIGTGSVLGIFFHAGHAQMWAYAALFFLFAIIILLCFGKLPLYRALYVIPAFLFALAVVMPLLIPQWLIVSDSPRYPTHTGMPYQGILAMLLPFPFTAAPHPVSSWGTAYDRQRMSAFYYSGTLFSAVFFGTILILLALLLFKRNRLLLLKRFIADNVWAVCCLVAFLLAMGDRGLLWMIQSKLPLLNKFRMPFKFLHYVNLFTAIGSGIIIERHIQFLRNRRLVSSILGLSVCCLMLYHVNFCTSSFYSYGDRPGRLQRYIDRGDNADSPDGSNTRRVLSLTAERSPKTGYIFSLNHNFPALFHAYAFAGYDYFIDRSPYFAKAKENLFSRPFEAARAYGIRWVVVDRNIESESFEEARIPELARFFLAHSHRHLLTPDFLLLRLDGAQPIAFFEDAPGQTLPVYIKPNGMDIDVSAVRKEAGCLVINMLWRPEIIIMQDKEKLKCASDVWGRVVAEVPVGARIIKFRYIPPWKAGFLAGLLCLLAAVLAYFLLKRKFL